MTARCSSGPRAAWFASWPAMSTSRRRRAVDRARLGASPRDTFPLHAPTLLTRAGHGADQSAPGPDTATALPGSADGELSVHARMDGAVVDIRARHGDLDLPLA